MLWRPTACLARSYKGLALSRGFTAGGSGTGTVSGSGSGSAESKAQETACYVWGGGKSKLDPTYLTSRTKAVFTPRILPPPQAKDRPSSPVKSISFGTNHALLVRADGIVFARGEGKNHELGVGQQTTTEEFIEVPGLTDVVQVAAGCNHSVALTQNGEVYTWGWGGSFFHPGALGHGSRESCPKPTKVRKLADQRVVGIAAGNFHTVVVTDEGKVYAWGRGEHGVLGTGGSSNALAPTLVDTLQGIQVTRVVCGNFFTAALTGDKRLWVWGRNDAGQLGQTEGMAHDMYNMEAIPTNIEAFDGKNILDVACGEKQMLAVTDQHEVYQWGNRQWLLPNRILGEHKLMTKIKTVQVAAGRGFALVVDEGGHLLSWGDGSSGCLGTGDQHTTHPVVVPGFGPDPKAHQFGRVVAVSAGHSHVAVVVNKH